MISPSELGFRIDRFPPVGPSGPIPRPGAIMPQPSGRRRGGRVAGRRTRRPQLEPMEPRTLLTTIVVTGTGDAIALDGVPIARDGVVTLREAITAANNNAA